MGQTSALGRSAGRSLYNSTTRQLLAAVERGWVPDSLVRAGIRKLIGSRLQELRSSHDEHTVRNFLAATQAQPIAVSQDLANEQHYEVPAEYFQSVLGPRMKYSCCFWPAGTESLDRAEEESLRITCERAELQDGMDVLELGCGWGSLSLWMAERYPNSHITAVSNSHSQREFIQRRAVTLGLSNLRVITADMNVFRPEGCYDRVVSVEMFEHMRNHRKLLNRIETWLRSNGKVLIHIFCHKHTPYLFRSDGPQNWMGRHFFTGGMMPSADLLMQSGSNLRAVAQWQWGGEHYAQTCRAWLSNHDACGRSLLPLLSQTYGQDQAIRWYHRWRMFFLACAELFATNDGQEWFVSHYLFEQRPCN